MHNFTGDEMHTIFAHRQMNLMKRFSFTFCIGFTLLFMTQEACANTCPAGTASTISGTVYTPNGLDPVAGAVVYVPTTTVQPFTPGVSNPFIGQLSGSPAAIARTDVTGAFTLFNVPAGSNIPLVIQSGRWRRQVTVSTVAECSNTTLPAALTHFPKNQTEGDIPQYAFVTGGSSTLECALRKTGIDDAEFTNPTGNGRIHFYLGAQASGATIVNMTSSETNLVGTVSTLNKYDGIFFACQGVRSNPNHTQITNLVTYANAGGRIFAEHYSYSWLYNALPFSGTATWNVDQTVPYDQIGSVNSTSLVGQFFAQWLMNVGASSTLGQVPLSVLRHDFDGVVAPSKTWISINNPSAPILYSFATPVGTSEDQQMGRVMFSDFHADDAVTGGKMFPQECSAGTMTPQEKIFEYFLFDQPVVLNQTITIPSMTDQTYGTTPNLGATTNSGLQLYYLSTTPAICDVSADGTLAFTSVGTCTITVTQTGDPSYLPATASTSFAVLPRPYLLTAFAQSKIYGSKDPSLSFADTGLVNGDLPSGSLTRTPGDTVGTYAITQGTLTVSGNYTLTFVGNSLSIVPDTLNIVNSLAHAKAYDGTTTATVTESSLTGILGTDTVSLNTGSANFDSKQKGTNKPVTVSGSTLSGAQAKNYVVKEQTGLFADITPRSLSLSGLAVADKIYDGTTPANITGGTLNTKVGGEDVSFTLAKSTFADASVGSSKQVTTHVSLTGADKDNYQIDSLVYLPGNILPAPLTIGVKDLTIAQGEPWDFEFTFDGFVNGDSSGIVQGLHAVTDADSVPGSYTVTPQGATAANYTITYENGTFTIIPVSTTIATKFPHSTFTGIAHASIMDVQGHQVWSGELSVMAGHISMPALGAGKWVVRLRMIQPQK